MKISPERAAEVERLYVRDLPRDNARNSDNEFLDDRKKALDEIRWIDDAVCADEELTLADYFPSAGFGPSAAAVDACRRCPVRLDCVRHAYRMHIMGYGMFGGLTPNQRFEIGSQGGKGSHLTLEEMVEAAVAPVRPVSKSGGSKRWETHEEMVAHYRERYLAQQAQRQRSTTTQ